RDAARPKAPIGEKRLAQFGPRLDVLQDVEARPELTLGHFHVARSLVSLREHAVGGTLLQPEAAAARQVKRHARRGESLGRIALGEAKLGERYVKVANGKGRECPRSGLLHRPENDAPSIVQAAQFEIGDAEPRGYEQDG